MAGDIIFLTGTSSSGKTSIAKGLQRALDRPFLQLSLDEAVKIILDALALRREGALRSLAQL